jgi:hypothetical protein
MLSDDGREASATGFMKAQMNGAAVIANPTAPCRSLFFRGRNTQGQTAQRVQRQLFQRPTRPRLFLKP